VRAILCRSCCRATVRAMPAPRIVELIDHLLAASRATLPRWRSDTAPPPGSKSGAIGSPVPRCGGRNVDTVVTATERRQASAGPGKKVPGSPLSQLVSKSKTRPRFPEPRWPDGCFIASLFSYSYRLRWTRIGNGIPCRFRRYSTDSATSIEVGTNKARGSKGYTEISRSRDHIRSGR
jgi:hypothetical protein